MSPYRKSAPPTEVPNSIQSATLPHWAKAIRCIKCGRRQYSPDAYCQGIEGKDVFDPCVVVGEHLHIRCMGCGYRWLTQCADAPGAPTKEQK